MTVNHHKNKTNWSLALGLFSALLLSGCGGGSSSVDPLGLSGTYQSAPMIVGGGSARSFIQYDLAGKPSSIGVRLTEAALSGLPKTTKTLFQIPLPKEANLTPFNHIEFRYWNHGHDPAGLFEVEHFDIIPFLMTQGERDQITATGDDLARVLRTPEADAFPIGYAQIPNVDEFYAEARYGTRFFDVVNFTPVLNHEKAYTTTLFYGYYDGQLNFFEIPVTFPFWKQKQNTTFAFPLPKRVPKSGYYPTAYRISFDTATKEYVFAMEGLIWKE